MRDLADGQAVDCVFLVRERSLRKKRNGEDFLRLTLSDSTGSVPAVCWDDATQAHELAEPGDAVRVKGRYEVSERYGPQLTVQALAVAAAGDYALTDLLDGPAMSIEQMDEDLRCLIETVRNPHLRRLLDACSASPPRSGGAFGARRRRSSTTRPTRTGCSSTR